MNMIQDLYKAFTYTYTRVYTHTYEHRESQNVRLGTESDSRGKIKQTEPETRASNRALEDAPVTHMSLLRAKISHYDTLDSTNLHVPVMRA